MVESIRQQQTVVTSWVALTTPVGRSFHPKIAGESAAMCGPARGEPIARVEARSNVQDWTGAGTLGGLSAQAVRETGQNGRD
jgi:hypothetical protein